MAEIPNVPAPLAKRYISDAWLEIQRQREWSFRHKDGIVLIPSEVTSGTINITKNATQGTFDATALAAFTADTQLPLIGYRQIRFPSRSERIYNITNLNMGTGVVTLDKIYTGTTDTASTYRIYSAYVYPLTMAGALDPYFERFLTMRSLDYGWTMIDGRHRLDRRQIDAYDPGRLQFNLPRAYCYHDHLSATVGDNRINYRNFEFWPHAATALQFESYYIQRAISFEEDSTQYLPEVIPPRLVIMRALMDLYRWADTNKATHPEYRSINWQFLRSQLSSKAIADSDTYVETLRRAIRNDNEILDDTIIPKLNSFTQNILALPTTLVVSSSSSS